MENIINQLSICIERGKENKQSPYPPDLKGLEGVRKDSNNNDRKFTGFR